MNSSASPPTALIAGSGIIGLACAHYLAKAGTRVTVIDRGRIAGECSYANCGYICPSHVLPLTEPGAVSMAIKSLFKRNAAFRVKPRFSPALWYWMFQFAIRCRHEPMLEAGRHLKAILDASMDEYKTLMQEEKLDCGWKENGLLYVLQSERGMNEFAETDRLLTEEFGVTARRIAGDDLPSLDPALKPGLAGAFLYEGDTSVRPDRLNAEWRSLLESNGVTFLENCELRGISKSGDRIQNLRTSHGDMEADAYVIALGASVSRWQQDLECRIPVQPGKGYSVTMRRPDPCPKYPMLLPEHRVGVSPFDDGYRLGSMMEFAGFDRSVSPARIQQLKDSAKPYLVTPFVEGEEERWFGWRPMTWDSLPIIGRVPKLENAWLATGHNMLGLSLATSTGRLIAELVRGESPHIDPMPYSPVRF